jgi:hypothetical protein
MAARGVNRKGQEDQRRRRLRLPRILGTWFASRGSVCGELLRDVPGRHVEPTAIPRRRCDTVHVHGSRGRYRHRLRFGSDGPGSAQISMTISPLKRRGSSSDLGSLSHSSHASLPHPHNRPSARNVTPWANVRLVPAQTPGRRARGAVVDELAGCSGRFTDDAVIPDKKGTDERERVRLNLQLEASE